MLRTIISWALVIMIGYWLITHGAEAGNFLHTAFTNAKQFVTHATG
jgi:hypothetical protein